MLSLGRDHLARDNLLNKAHEDTVDQALDEVTPWIQGAHPSFKEYLRYRIWIMSPQTSSSEMPFWPKTSNCRN